MVAWDLYLSSDNPAYAAYSPPTAAAPVSGGAPSPLIAPARSIRTADAGPQNCSTPPSGGQVVVAHDGAIVFIGDNGILKANTGDTSASGAVAIDTSDSTLTSGASGNAAGGRATTAAGPTAAGGSGAEPRIVPTSSSSGQAGSSSGRGGRVPAPAAAVVSDIAPNLGDRPVAIAGFENHSVNVAGNDQVATYDDSNVFINRNGKINGNTGDTDSSGLNAVDVTRSVVRSGASTDGDTSDDSDDGSGAGTTALPADEAALPTTAGASAAGAGVAGAGPTGAPANPAGNDSASSTDSDSSTSATGTNPLVVGGDGYDDLAIRATGNRNLVTYDDSHLVIGGTGDVNAQIGDSDTGGTVVMGIDQSDVEGGASS